MRPFIFLLFMALSHTLHATAVSGFVFADKNNNGQKDKDEAGIRGVAVSDQVQVVRTDGNGRYAINDVKGYGLIMISLPDGYKPATTYWQRAPEAGGDLNFALIKTPAVTSFTFLHASDTHISDASLPRTQRLRTMADSLKPAFVLVTGDLIRDALRVPEKEVTGLYDLYLSETHKFSMPVWSAAGNHDNFGIERHLSLVGKNNPLYGKKNVSSLFRSQLL